MSGAAGAPRITDPDQRRSPDDGSDDRGFEGVPLIAGSVSGRCPRCGARTLFAGPATFSENCPACGLDFSSFNVGDGPAAFLILIVGGLIVALAAIVEIAAEPPFWVHILLWLPLTLILVVGALRIAKAMLLTLAYRHDAREGRQRSEP
jgi:uncharacterized protein (DUF983 family)